MPDAVPSGSFTGTFRLDAAGRPILDRPFVKADGTPLYAFGAYAEKEVTTIYRAETDGYAIVTLEAFNIGDLWQGVVQAEAATPPQTHRGGAEITRAEMLRRASICVPVPKGYYWRVTVAATTGTPTVEVYWLPAGPAGPA